MAGFNRTTPTDFPDGLPTTASINNSMSPEQLPPRTTSADRRILRILEKHTAEFIETRSDQEIDLILRLPEKDVEAMFTVWQADQITSLSKNWKNDWMRANVADANLFEAKEELKDMEKKLESTEQKLEFAEEKLRMMREILEEKLYTEKELEAQIRYLGETTGQGMSASSELSLAGRLKLLLGNRLGR